MGFGVYRFSQSDIIMQYVETDDVVTFDSENFKNFCIIFFISGRAEFSSKSELYYASPGDIFLAHSNDEFSITYGGVKTKYLQIRFEPQFFQNIDPDANIMRPFFEKKSIHLFNVKTNEGIFKEDVAELIEYLKNHKSRIYVVGSFIRILCRINDMYEERYPLPIMKTDSTFAKLMAYVDRHIYDDITLESASKHLFISPRGITKVCRKYTGFPFHKFIIKIRIEKAQHLIESREQYPMNRIATMCGFKNYTTFYRCFKSFIGVSPDEYLNNYHKKQKKR